MINENNHIKTCDIIIIILWPQPRDLSQHPSSGLYHPWHPKLTERDVHTLVSVNIQETDHHNVVSFFLDNFVMFVHFVTSYKLTTCESVAGRFTFS